MNGKCRGLEGLSFLAQLNNRQIRLTLLWWRLSLLAWKTSRGNNPEHLSMGPAGPLELSQRRWASSSPVYPVGAGGGDAVGLAGGEAMVRVFV